MPHTLGTLGSNSSIFLFLPFSFSPIFVLVLAILSRSTTHYPPARLRTPLDHLTSSLSTHPLPCTPRRCCRSPFSSTPPSTLSSRCSTPPPSSVSIPSSKRVSFSTTLATSPRSPTSASAHGRYFSSAGSSSSPSASAPTPDVVVAPVAVAVAVAVVRALVTNHRLQGHHHSHGLGHKPLRQACRSHRQKLLVKRRGRRIKIRKR